MPRPGQVVHIGKACGVPYSIRPIHFAVAEVAAYQPHAEGAWLIGYELNDRLKAVDRREIYVGQLAGLRDITAEVDEYRRRAARQRTGNDRRVVPQQRTRTTPATTTSGRTR